MWLGSILKTQVLGPLCLGSQNKTSVIILSCTRITLKVDLFGEMNTVQAMCFH